MEVNNTTGAYSPNVVYGQLVKINVHTPYDKTEEDDAAVTMKDFKGNLKNFKYAKTDDEDYAFGIETNYKPSTVDNGAEKVEFPPKSVKSFRASEVPSNKDIVRGAIKSGYSYNEAYLMTQREKAYAESAGIAKQPINALNGRNFRTVPG